MASGQIARRIDDGLEPLHRRLAEFNRARLSPSLDVVDWQQQLRQEHDLRVVEGHVLESERSRIAAIAKQAPTQPRELVDWLEALREPAELHSHALFSWLARSADHSELTWFLVQELTSPETPEDLFALAQLQLPWRSKLEIGRCYWDEMGQGYAAAMRSRILDNFTHDLHVDATHPLVWEELARSNLMLGLCSNRRYGYHALGALGAVELTMGSPARLVAEGLSRLGYSVEASAYFASRAKLAKLRSHAWNQDVILPLVAQDARCARAIAEGALMRIASANRCFERYARQLGVELGGGRTAALARKV